MKKINLFLLLLLSGISLVSSDRMPVRDQIDYRLDMYKHLFLTPEFQKASRKVQIQAMQKIVAQEYKDWVHLIKFCDLIHARMKKISGHSIYRISPDYELADHSARALLFSQKVMLAVINKECKSPAILSEPTQEEFQTSLFHVKERRRSEQTNLAIRFLFEVQNQIQQVEEQHPREKQSSSGSCSLM